MLDDPNRGNVPIIGQPQIGDWTFAINVVCSCKKVTMLVGRPGSVVTCTNPLCGKLFRLNGFPTLAPDGVNIVVPLAVGHVTAVSPDGITERRRELSINTKDDEQFDEQLKDLKEPKPS